MTHASTQGVFRGFAQRRASARYERAASAVERELGSLRVEDWQCPPNSPLQPSIANWLQDDQRQRLAALLRSERAAWQAAFGVAPAAPAIAAYAPDASWRLHRGADDYCGFVQQWLDRVSVEHVAEERKQGVPMQPGWLYHRRLPGTIHTSRFLIVAGNKVISVDGWGDRHNGMPVPLSGSWTFPALITRAESDASIRLSSGAQPELGWAAHESTPRARAFLGATERQAFFLVAVSEPGKRTRNVLQTIELGELAKEHGCSLSSLFSTSERASLQQLAVPPMAANALIDHHRLVERLERTYNLQVEKVPRDRSVLGRVLSVVTTEGGKSSVLVASEQALYLLGGDCQTMQQLRALKGSRVTLQQTAEGLRVQPSLVKSRHHRRDVGLER